MAGIDPSSPEIVIPATFEYEGTTYRIKEIGEGAFRDCRDITGITLPEGLKTIGNSAFRECTSLKRVTIPGSVRTIGESAFSGCSSLEHITIPEGVTGIRNAAFADCTSLRGITLPEGLLNIGGGVFHNCYALENVTLPDSLMDIGHGTFWNCRSLREITIPEGVEDIGVQTFDGCTSLTKAVLPGSIRHISDYAFSGCTSLTDLNIPEHAKLGRQVFSVCPKFEQKDWTITIANSETRDTILLHFKGTMDEVQKALFNLAAEDRNSDAENYDYGIDSPDDLECTEDGRKFAASVSYADYHMDYTAEEDSRIEELGRDILKWEVPPLNKKPDAGVYAKNLRFEKLKEALLAEGTDAVVDFLGWSYDPSHEDWELENDMESVYEQMPEKELEAFYEKYGIQDTDAEQESEEDEEEER